MKWSKMKLITLLLISLVLLVECASAQTIYITSNPLCWQQGSANTPSASIINDNSAPNQTSPVWNLIFDGSGQFWGAKNTNYQNIQWQSDFGLRQLNVNDIVTVRGSWKASTTYPQGSANDPISYILLRGTYAHATDWYSSYVPNDNKWHNFQIPMIITKSGTGTIDNILAFSDIGCACNIEVNNISITVTHATVPTNVVKAKKTLVCMGDSLTYGNTAWTYHVNYPSALHYLLPGWRIYNAGVMGNTPAQMMARWAANVTAIHPTYVILLSGTNGIYNVPQQEHDIYTMWMWARTNGSIPIACTIPSLPAYASNVNTLNAWIRTNASANGIALIDYYKILADPNNSSQVDPRWASGDGTHMSDDGYVQMVLQLPYAYVFRAYPAGK